MKWHSTEPPRDRMIMRYHRLWKVAIPVIWTNTLIIGQCQWLIGTKSSAWPEESFLKEWSECPLPPNTKKTKVKVTISEPCEHTFEDDIIMGKDVRVCSKCGDILLL